MRTDGHRSDQRGVTPRERSADVRGGLRLTREVIDENSAAEAWPWATRSLATDADSGDTLTYALSGDDAMYFSIDEMGQITVGAGAMLDYETKMSYMVTVTATDPDGKTDTIDVTINVTDVEENPLLVKYDTNGDQTIERSEVIAAIARYFDEEAGVTRAEVIAVIALYFGN